MYIFLRNRDSAHLHVRLEKMKKHKETLSQNHHMKSILKHTSKRSNNTSNNHRKLTESCLRRILQRKDNQKQKKEPINIEDIPKL